MRDRSPITLWQTALGRLELQVTRPNFETWLRNTQAIDLRGDELIVGVPNDFAIEWLRSRMSGLINRTASELAGQTLSVSYQVLGSQALPAPATATGAAPAPSVAPRPALDDRLTFDTFVVLKSNRVAYRAARRAAAGKVDFNPLVLSGPPGLGKTHLLHAIGHLLAAAGKAVAVLTGEAFVTRYVAAVRRGDPGAFRAQFEGCDALLLDDVQFLAAKTSSQQQFFHIFEAFHSAGRLIAVTTDIPPTDIAGLSSRLRSRLLAGLVVDVQPLSRADRQQLLDAKLSSLSANLAPDVVRLIADQPYASMRELDGALHRLAALAESAAAPLSTAEAEQALQATASGPAPLTTKAVLETVARYFQLSPEQLAGPSRARDITYARHIAMYFLRERCALSLTQIGTMLGRRDHTTVLSACQRILGELGTLPQTKEAVEKLATLLDLASAA